MSTFQGLKYGNACTSIIYASGMAAVGINVIDLYAHEDSNNI